VADRPAPDGARARGRVRAPELTGRRWLNTGGRPLGLADLRGRFVLLDFWTFCCVNCLHVLDELRPLEERWGDVLVVVGVHSPKFVHEGRPEAVEAAVERYRVEHPVLDDPDLATWRAYAVRAWPTLALVDPEGYVVAQLSGEGHAHALDALLAELVAEHEAKGTLRRGDAPYEPPPPAATALRFPAKAVALPGGGFLVADAGRHSLAVLADDGETLLRRIGSGDPGLTDGGPGEARFSEPNGLALLPAEVAAAAGYDVVVADTVNHALRGVRLADGSVTTLAGGLGQWMQGDGVDRLTSPWDVAWHGGRVWIAMAGNHQLWTYDPATGRVEVAAGTTNEGLVDGDLADAWFAQTSGLAADGESLWLADSETSSLREVRNGTVRTHVGSGLFDFGHVDGPATEALLQHPLGLAVLPDGSVAVADTYNGAVRRYDPARAVVETLATGLAEPSGLLVADGGATLVVVESAAHRLTRVPVPREARRLDGARLRTQRPPTELAPGPIELAVVFEPPPGQHLDDRYGPSTHVVVSSTPPGLLAEGAGAGPELVRRIVLSADHDGGVLHVSARAASCDDDSEHAACHVHQQDWGVPVRIAAGAPARLALTLAGLDA
jgi:thiol-disulfide isomerase/thioredoxin